GSDPEKLARYRALSRLHTGWAETPTPERLAFGRGLALVAEHTWGGDIKTYLRDETAWDRAEFAAARRTDYRFANAGQCRAGQRAYVGTALAALGPADRAEADAALAALVVAPEAAPVAGTTLRDGGWTAELDAASGDIVRLSSPGGRVLEGLGNSLIGYRHES